MGKQTKQKRAAFKPIQAPQPVKKAKETLRIFTNEELEAILDQHDPGFVKGYKITDHPSNPSSHKLGKRKIFVKGIVGLSVDTVGHCGSYCCKEFKISRNKARYICTVKYIGKGKFRAINREGGGDERSEYDPYNDKEPRDYSEFDV